MISDHAPVQATLQWVPPTPRDERPIPKFICEHPAFGVYHDKLCIAANLDDLPVVTRWMLRKEMMREAASITRGEMLTLPGDEGKCK
eukprot:9879883-Heterocapsa_arctica.AAC.1